MSPSSARKSGVLGKSINPHQHANVLDRREKRRLIGLQTPLMETYQAICPDGAWLLLQAQKTVH